MQSNLIKLEQPIEYKICFKEVQTIFKDDDNLVHGEEVDFIQRLNKHEVDFLWREFESLSTITNVRSLICITSDVEKG